MEKIRIQDESGDKKYFTQLPSIILNHSTANDQALYWQMKRYAGEDGQCFATEETLCKKLGIGRRAYWKSRDYLLKKGWIKFDGMKGGKTRPIKTYSIVDIWKINIMEYEKISAESNISNNKEIVVEKQGDSCQKQHKIVVEKHIEEDLTLRRTIKKSRNFVAPSLLEVKIYCKERNNSLDAEQFVNFYESKGWFVGKNKMKNWQAAVRTWENRDIGKSKVGSSEEIIIPEYAKGYIKKWKD